jgi:hypothetical protein
MKIYLSTLICIFFCSTNFAQDYNKLNRDRNLANAPNSQIIYTIDTSINQVNFGQKKNKRPFVIIFPFRQVQDPKTSFTFSQSQIKGTNMSQNSGVTGIELTAKGFEITYNPKDKLGQIDDYVVVHTENGEVMLRLIGEIIDAKKNNEQ